MIAGVRTEDGRGLADAARAAAFRRRAAADRSARTRRIGVVATNARLTKTEATKVAQMAHDGLARVISPVHTMYDGDTVFALATGSCAGTGRRHADRRARRRRRGRRRAARGSRGDGPAGHAAARDLPPVALTCPPAPPAARRLLGRSCSRWAWSSADACPAPAASSSPGRSLTPAARLLDRARRQHRRRVDGRRHGPRLPRRPERLVVERIGGPSVRCCSRSGSARASGRRRRRTDSSRRAICSSTTSAGTVRGAGLGAALARLALDPRRSAHRHRVDPERRRRACRSGPAA